MAAFNKFNVTVQKFVTGLVNLNADTLRLALYTAGTAPAATDSVYAATLAGGAVEVANGNGYTTKGNSGVGVAANVAGTTTMRTAAAIPTWTASAAGFAFRRMVFFDDTAAADDLLGWWDYGSTLTLDGTNGDTFTALGFDTAWATIL